MPSEDETSDFNRTGPGSLTLPNLVEEAKSSYGLPLFQRELKWKWNHQKELLTSIMNNVPIGTILLWDYDRETSEKDINMRPINSLEKEEGDINTLVLDGQQRVTFLTWLWQSAEEEKFADILGEHSGKDGGYIYLHLDEDAGKPVKKGNESNEKYKKRIAGKRFDRFSIGKKGKNIDKQNNRILVQYLLQEGISTKDIKAKFDKHPNKEWISDLRTGLRDSSVNTYRLGSDVGYGQALVIYERVNVAGTKLQGRDVTEAVFISQWKDLFTNLNDLEKKLSKGTPENPTDFTSIFQRKRIMNCMTDEIFGTISAKPKNMEIFNPTDPDGNVLDEDLIRTAFNRVERSLSRVKKILQNYFNLRNDKQIGTDWPIVIASSYIRTHYPEDNADMGNNKGELAKWMALAILRKHYTGGSTNTKIEDDLEAVQESKTPWDKLYENMSKSDRVQLPPKLCSKLATNDLGTIDIESSKTPPSMTGKSGWLGGLYKAVLFRYNARDPHTLELIRDEEETQWHHIFPKAMFDSKSKHYAGKDFEKENLKLRDNPANYSLISKGTNLRIRAAWPEKYIVPIIKAHQEIAIKHQWDNPDLAQKNAFRKFIIWRQGEMRRFINNFFDDICGNVEPPVPEGIINHMQRIKGVPEGQIVEYKATLRVHTKGEDAGKVDTILEHVVLKEICSMMNSGGGWLYIGVSEEEIKGKITNVVTGIHEDITSLDDSKKGKKGNWEFLESHLRKLITNHIIIPDDLNYKRNDLIAIDRVEFKEEGEDVMALRIYPWSQRNAAYRKSNKSTEAVEWNREGGSKNPGGPENTWIKINKKLWKKGKNEG